MCDHSTHDGVPCTCCEHAPEPVSSHHLDAIGLLVGELRGRLVAIARSEGLGPEDALDVTQDAFYTFLQRPDAASLLAKPDECANVLVVIVRNTARNLRRRHHLSRPHDDAALADRIDEAPVSADALLLQAEEHVKLQGCVATLDDVYRTVVTLRMLEEKSGEDVAKVLGVSRNHVGVLLHRAKGNLRRCMLRYDDTESTKHLR